MRHDLHVWAGEHRVARIEHDAKDDRWSMAYDSAWSSNPQAFPLSPALPFESPAGGHASASLKRFIEHVLPEGRALDVAVNYNGLTKSNVFGLIRALGSETAGALRFTANADGAVSMEDTPPREIPLQELDQRIAQREAVPLTVWDGQVRMSVAGLQDKLLVYIDGSPEAGGKLFLVHGHRLASTHILKPDTGKAQTPHLAVNEHFCMSLARRMGLPAAEVHLLRSPRPVLVVTRFDREVHVVEGTPEVRRHHIIDACQACDMPVSFKYERNLGRGPQVKDIREGVSFERLFGCVALTGSKAATRRAMLQWALFQFLIGNTDAHGKNFSFHVQPGGLLRPTNWYDLVSVLQYTGLNTELAMAYGDVFVHGDLSAFALADFATRCGIDRKLMRREGLRLAKLASIHATAQADAAVYEATERPFIAQLATFVAAQSDRLAKLVVDAATIPANLL